MAGRIITATRRLLLPHEGCVPYQERVTADFSSGARRHLMLRRFVGQLRGDSLLETVQIPVPRLGSVHAAEIPCGGVR